MTRLLIVRHGLSMTNRGGRFTGQADSPLAEEGERQVERLSEWLLSRELPIDAVYASDLSRAKNTVLPTARALGLEVVTDRRLRELDVGEWYNRPFEEVQNEDPAFFAAYRAGKVSCPGGESMYDVRLRTLEVLREIVARHGGETVLVGTHNGNVRSVAAECRGLLPGEISQVKGVENTSITEVLVTEAGWELRRYGAAEHLARADQNE